VKQAAAREGVTKAWPSAIDQRDVEACMVDAERGCEPSHRVRRDLSTARRSEAKRARAASNGGRGAGPALAIGFIYDIVRTKSFVDQGST
jgi:hypothetical protein